MTTIKIDSQNVDYIYFNDDWKDYIIDNFDEVFVIHGNNHCNKIIDASWYNSAISLMTDFDMYFEDDDFYDMYKDEFTIEQWNKLCDIYKHCRYYDDDETILKVLTVMFPERHFKSGTINGNSQGDWNNVLYDSDKFDDISRLEDFYYGNVSEIMLLNDDETVIDERIITNSDIWDAERKDLKKYIIDLFGLSDNELKIYVSDGYIQTTKWKEVI